ncbi:MAG: competence protein CoiA family protein [Hylemonella sp.]
MENELLVPYGLAPDGTLIHAKDALRDGLYSCPQCATPLVLKAGAMVARHFAHKADTNCSGESVAHETAKLLIAKVLCEQFDAPETAKRILLTCECDCCKQHFSKLLTPDTFTSVAVEEPVGRYRCDVVAFRGEAQALGIEVVSSNAIHAEKAEELSIHWIELRALDVIEDPYKWNPVNARLKPALCKKCKAALKRLEEVAARWQQPLTQYAGYKDPMRATYLAALRKCWKCREEMVSYWWPGVPFCESAPPEPRPPSVQLRRSSSFGGRYWANCCPNCGQIDGDNFLFMNLDGQSPFAGLSLGRSETMNRYRADASKEAINFMLRNF